MKLCYLADLENVRRFGRQITEAEWRRDNYGAVAYEIPNTARNSPAIAVRDYTTYTGHHGTEFLLEGDASHCPSELSLNERAVLDDVWERFGHWTAKDLGLETKKTKPWKAAEADNASLDLSIVAREPQDRFAYFARVLESADLSVRGTPEEIAALEDETDRFMTPLRLEAMRDG